MTEEQTGTQVEIEVDAEPIEDKILAGMPHDGYTLEEAILAVMAKIRWIQRSKVAGVSYPVLLEDEVLEKIQPELLKYGLTIAPEKVKVAFSETYTTNKGQSWNRTILTVQYSLTHAKTGQSKRITAAGEGADPGDKSVAKAMTMALKYALRQAFLVRTGTDDPDKTPSEESARPGHKPKEPAKPPQNSQPNSGPKNPTPPSNKQVFERACGAIKTAPTVEKLNEYIKACSERNFNEAQMNEINKLSAVRLIELGQNTTNTDGVQI